MFLALPANLSAGKKALFLVCLTLTLNYSFSLSKLHVIEQLKSYIEATPSRQVDQLWPNEECCRRTREREMSRPKLWLPYLLSWPSWVAAEITSVSSYSGLYAIFISLKLYTSMSRGFPYAGFSNTVFGWM